MAGSPGTRSSTGTARKAGAASSTSTASSTGTAAAPGARGDLGRAGAALAPALAVLTLVVPALVTLPAAPAAAVSSAALASTPESIALGRDGYPAVDLFDGVAIGTVTDLRGSGDPPEIEVGLALTGTFGPPLPADVVLLSPDSGAMAGHPFVEGEHYAVPYRQDADGRHTSVCDPIHRVDPADVPRLVALADDGAWPRPADAPGTALGVLPAGQARPGGGAGPVVTAVAVLLAAGAAIALAVRRRRRADRAA